MKWIILTGEMIMLMLVYARALKKYTDFYRFVKSLHTTSDFFLRDYERVEGRGAK